MEFFNSKYLNDKLDNFLKVTVPETLNKCNYCCNFSCQYHKKFRLDCSLCRDIRCSQCMKFQNQNNVLISNGSDELRHYLSNFLSDFINLSDETFKCFFPEIEVKKVETQYYRKRVKSEKNRSQIVNVNIPNGARVEQWMFKGRKRKTVL